MHVTHQLIPLSLGVNLSGSAGIMAGFSSALLTRKAFLGGSAKVGRDTNGAKTFALFKKAEKKVKQATGPAKKNVKQAQKKVLASYSSHIPCCRTQGLFPFLLAFLSILYQQV